MMEHYHLDGLVQYGSEALPSTLLVVNPARRLLDKAVKENTLTVRIHRMACPAHDKAISSLLADLTKAGFHHPQTGA